MAGCGGFGTDTPLQRSTSLTHLSQPATCVTLLFPPPPAATSAKCPWEPFATAQQRPKLVQGSSSSSSFLSPRGSDRYGGSAQLLSRTCFTGRCDVHMRHPVRIGQGPFPPPYHVRIPSPLPTFPLSFTPISFPLHSDLRFWLFQVQQGGI